MFDFRSARAIQEEKQRQAGATKTPHQRGDMEFRLAWKRVAIAVATGALLISLLAISGPVSPSGSSPSPPDATTSDVPVIDGHPRLEKSADGTALWEGR